MNKPVWHYHPAKNWINDPNGLCQVDGVYHMYYQYNPGGDLWGDIHWGHATSRDLLHWEELPPAMHPAHHLGEVHCFSGGCCKDENGQPHFFYTSIGSKENGRDARFGPQQWHAEPDGSLNHLRQTDKNALTSDIHGGMKVLEWRDPCVIRCGGQYLMVLGGCVEGHGCVLLYTSPDMQHWTYHSILAQSELADGVTWECPNLLEVDGHFVLLYSPCGPVIARVGLLDEALHFRTISECLLESGARNGYYAPQCFTDENKRAILFGWMPECDHVRKGWSGVMSLPRVMHVQDGQLTLQPLDTLYTLAQRELSLPCNAESIIVRARFDASALPLTLALHASPDGREQTLLTLDADGTLTCDRSRSTLTDGPEKTPVTRIVRISAESNELLAIADCGALEIMVNGAWLSTRVYPSLTESTGVRLDSRTPIEAKAFT